MASTRRGSTPKRWTDQRRVRVAASPLTRSSSAARRDSLGADAGTLAEPVGTGGAKAISDLAADGDHRRRLGEANQVRARAEFGVERMVDSVARIYGDALGV